MRDPFEDQPLNTRPDAALHFLRTIEEHRAAGASSAAIAASIGSRSLRSLAGSLRPIRDTLASFHIKRAHIYKRTTDPAGGSRWHPGPRFAEALHWAAIDADMYTRGNRRPTPPPTRGTPCVTLHGYESRVALVALPDGIGPLEAILDEWDRGEAEHGSLLGPRMPGEYWAAAAEEEPGRAIAIPQGYGPHGRWTRGKHDAAAEQAPTTVLEPNTRHNRVTAAIARLDPIARRMPIDEASLNPVATAWRQATIESGFTRDPRKAHWEPRNGPSFHACIWIDCLAMGRQYAAPGGSALATSTERPSRARTAGSTQSTSKRSAAPSEKQRRGPVGKRA